MKKKTTKNYIAFTLTEMTMVLLIMSVLAAVTAPIVKHAVSDVVNTSEADSSDDSPWKKLSNLSGIFYSSVGNGIVSVGAIPGGAPTNYSYPTMIIQSNGSDKNSDISQIGFYNGSNTNSQRIAFDRYNNIAIGRNIRSHSTPSLTNLPYGKIEIGSNIGTHGLKNSAQAVIIGNDVLLGSYASAEHTIAIGSKNSTQGFSVPNFDNSINIGYYNSVEARDENYNSINIGSYSSFGTSAYGSISIGYYAGSFAKGYSRYNISIGSLAHFVEAGVGNTNIHRANINLGRYSGYVTKFEDSPAPNIYLNKYNGNINIGQFAGSITSRLHKPSVEAGDKYIERQNNIAIGLGT